MSIVIQPELESRLRARAEAEGVTIQAYVERIARDDEAAEEELEALAIEGLSSGQPIKGSKSYWDEKRRRIVDRSRNTGARSEATTR
ncbi:MAG TPA: hypothetical protein VN924_33525 [Bryobacteraceae bacterium]|nr:hypothetical protein [Bryobacteraceae bacterium]